MNKYIEEMIKQGILVGGKIIEKNGFIIFKRLPFEELVKLNEQDLAYATQSMGRAIFTINSNNKITNIKGVDSQLDNTELAPAQLVQAESVYISNPNKSYSESTYPINLVKFPGEQNNSLDIRFRGAAPLEDLEIEAEINKKMQYMGIKLPKIDFVKEFTKEFCESIGLPTKIPGNYSELESDYTKQNDERKQFLKQEYGNQYQEEVIEGMRAETINEFFIRLGIYELPEFLEFAKKLNMTIEDFEKIKENLQKEYDEFWTPGVLKSELENKDSKYIVAKDKENILGFAGIWISPIDVEITNIVIKKTERKKGIGSLLLDKLIEMAKETKKDNISLEVNENNLPAINLYKKYGFETLGIRKKYYNGIDNALIMTKYFYIAENKI